MDPEVAEAAIKLLQKHSVRQVSRMISVNYMAVYRMAKGKRYRYLTKGKQILRSPPERKLDQERTHWAWTMVYHKDKSVRRIAQKLEMSIPGLYKALNRYDHLMAHRAQKLFLTSGSNEAAIRLYGFTAEDFKRFEKLALKPLPKRLQKELEDD